ncbi:hypothetical protein BDV11DRAFT_191679 [Aspergillus similis]
MRHMQKHPPREGLLPESVAFLESIRQHLHAGLTYLIHPRTIHANCANLESMVGQSICVSRVEITKHRIHDLTLDSPPGSTDWDVVTTNRTSTMYATLPSRLSLNPNPTGRSLCFPMTGEPATHQPKSPSRQPTQRSQQTSPTTQAHTLSTKQSKACSSTTRNTVPSAPRTTLTAFNGTICRRTARTC